MPYTTHKNKLWMNQASKYKSETMQVLEKMKVNFAWTWV